MRRYLFFIVLLFSAAVSANTMSSPQINWHYKSIGQISGKPVIHQNKVYFLSDHSLKVLSTKGTLEWQYNLKAKTFSEVAINNEAIYLLADNGLHAIDHNGKLQWHFKTLDQPSKISGESWGWGNKKVVDIWSWYRSSPVIVGNKVIFGNVNGTYAISTKTGHQLWHSKTGVTHTKPAIDEEILVIGSWNNTLYGINTETGAILWEFEGRIPYGKMANWNGWYGFNLDPIIYNNTVYVGNRGSFFYAIDVKTGIENWSTQYATSWIGSAAIESNGNIYFGTSDGFSFVGLDAKKGSQTLLQLNDFYNFAQPQATPNHLFYGSTSGQVYQIDKTTGLQQKIFSTPESKANYESLVLKEGGYNNQFSNGDDYNYANSLKDVKHMQKKLNGILSMTAHDLTLYVATTNGDLFSIAIK